MIGGVALMKTPQEWMRWIEQETVDPMQKGFTHEVLLTEEAIAAIQEDAFDAGRVVGLSEAADVIRDAKSCVQDVITKSQFGIISEHFQSMANPPKDTPCSKKGEM